MELSVLLQDITLTECKADFDFHVTGIASDSRKVKKGYLFICIKGEHHDGHLYISDAVERGAAVIVASCSDMIPVGVPYVLVENTRSAEAYIWNRWYGCPHEKMKYTVAVTGTCGKTSTAFMLREIFRSAGCKVGVITTVRAMAEDRVIDLHGGSSVSDAAGAMTTPDPEYLYGAIYEMQKSGVDALIFEASSHALSQYKIDPIAPSAAVFTNLSEEHLDYHLTMENYYKAKARLADLADICVLNIDDCYFERLAESLKGRKKVVSCSAFKAEKHDLSEVSALRINVAGLSGVDYIYFSEKAVFKVTSPIPGEFTVYNSMLAAAAALSLGIPPEAVRDGIASLRGVDGRLEAVDTGCDDLPFSVFIDYAHTPAAIESLLRTVRKMRRDGERITLLFGCGGDRDRSKRRKMGAAASRLSDFVIVTSDNCRNEDPAEIIKEILLGIDTERPHAVICDRREAIEYAVREARAGDILILAGKGHEKYEIDSGGKKPFDECELVREAVRKFYL